jgi:N-hydroxyarylamine O-acetyltransferase
VDAQAYLRRIDYKKPVVPDARTLRELHIAHLMTTPFENLDIHLGRQIVLVEEKLIAKIVGERRGGFCYELNGAFAALLRGVGFKVEMLSAGVANKTGGFDPPFDHMALAVTLEDRWLADVGFGDSFREPLLLDSRAEQKQNGEIYRIIDEGDGDHLILERNEADIWKPQYRFTIQPYELADFAEMCRYHQTSPDSPFTNKRTCTLATPDGRITITGMRFITTAGGERSERPLNDMDEYADALRTHFGIELPHLNFKQM